ncbi:MAG: hypothetical protein GXO49_06155, partial [Chlorobi bacterium]|nr:hypothetical protein [Chlorobiota bacterium]
MIKKALLLLGLFITLYHANAQELEEIDKTTPNEILDNQLYGSAIDIDGNYAVIGSSGYDNNRGRAFVLHYNGSEWEKVAILTASNGMSSDYFNHARISEDVIVIGARNSNAETINSGSAYVFVKPATGWEDMTETAILRPSDPVYDDWFGYKVDILNNTIVVGASHASSSGSVYIYEKPTNGWENMTETIKLLPSDGEEGDRFGSAVYI